ncbi:hypothetical protein D3C75_1202330 [compost metagenome]
MLVGFESQEQRAVKQEQQHHAHTRHNGIDADQVPEGAYIVHVLVDGHTAHQVGQGYAPQKRRQQAAEEDGPVPEASPLGILELAAELEGYAAPNQSQQHQEQSHIKSAE